MGKRALKYAPITEARTRHRLRPSHPSRPALLFLRILAPFYMRFVLKFSSVTIHGLDEILDAWRDFQEKRTRLILAFRHPYGEEPQLFSHVFDILLPRKARHSGNPLPKRPHARFVHGYEVALWGTALIRWILPWIGAVPVYHVKFDAAGLRAIRTILRDDAYPLALAPEGQVSYRSETLPRLEQGSVRMGFWCAQDIEKAHRTERVIILPLSVHYRFDPRDTDRLMVLIGRDEAACGMIRTSSDAQPLALGDRLISLENSILNMTEAHYEKTYGYQPPISQIQAPGMNDAMKRQLRWDGLMDASLDLAEHALGIFGKPQTLEDRITRVYRIRQLGWDRIYPEEPADPACALRKGLDDRCAGEAWYAMRHMEFVDLMFYLDSEYMEDTTGTGPSFDRLVETAYNLDDLVSRLTGGNFSNRSNVMRKKAVIIPGAALDISARLADYRKDWKEAVRTATADLAQSYLQCIKEHVDEKKD